MALAGIGGMTMSQSAMAQATSATSQKQFSIPAGSLREALDTLASRSGITVMYSPDLVAGKTTRGLSGSYTPIEALRRLLQGSGLEAQDAGDSTFTLRRAVTPAANPAGTRQGGTRNAPTTAQSTEPETQDMEKITVTGTRIRGGSTPSPVTTIGSERIREEGFADLGEAVRSIPQNFRGGQNPGVAAGATLGAGAGANQNVTGGSSLNLRGLGPDATLTLLNGRRMSYGGFVQAVDISAIPVEAVDRIEIVADGASAIYGSDAVGGVGNVILKRDFEGVSLGTRYGTATDGGLTTREYTATAGTVWTSGGLIATYQNVSVDPIYSGQRDYTDHMIAPTTIYPGRDLRSGLLSIHQSLGEAVELRLDALRTEREQLGHDAWIGFGNMLSSPETTTSLVSPLVEFSLPNDWTLTLGGTWGKDEHLNIQSRQNPTTGAFAPLFYDCYCNESRIYDIGAEGPLFAMGGGDARLAVGTGYRTNQYRQINYISDSTTTEGKDSNRFAYAEIGLPWISPDSNVARVQRLEMSAAVRTEDYDSFGRVTTPKLGLIYSPNTDITMKVSWGRSFKTPTLDQRYYSQVHYLDLAENNGGFGYPAGATVLVVGGGNPDLKPERARTWTTSLAFHPQALPSLEMELAWFNIDYTDRVIEPIADWGNALVNPNYAEFIDFFPTLEEQESFLAGANRFRNYTGAPYDPSNVVAIIHSTNVNADRQRVKGLDFSGSYWFDLGAGRLTIRGSTTWLDISQQTAGTPHAYEITGAVYNPAKINSRLGAVWGQRGFTASAFANFTSGVTNNTLDGRRTGSFTTLDAVLRYSTGDRGDAWSGLEFAVAAQNLLDRAPPLHATANLGGIRQVPPYDSTNYSAIGRFLSVSVSKRW